MGSFVSAFMSKAKYNVVETKGRGVTNGRGQIIGGVRNEANK